MTGVFTNHTFERRATALRMNWTGACLLLVAMLFARATEATTYYVSRSGSDANSCGSAQSTTQTSQKATIAAGVACLVAGDTLFIHGGTYTGSTNVIDSQTRTVNSGTSFANAVTIAGYPGEMVILQPPDNVSGIRLTTGSPHFLIFKDFTIDMINSTPTADADGIYLSTAHHNRMQRLEVKNSYNNGVHFGFYTSFNEVLDCRIHNNRVPNIGPAPHGLYITASDNLFEGNEVYSNQGYGFHIYNNHGSHDDPSRNIIRNNRVYGNGVYGTQAYGVVVAWGSDNVVYNNIIYRNRGGIQVYTDSVNTRVYNNTIYGNATEGIALQYHSTGQTIRNNIVYGNGAGIVDYGGAAPAAVDHNLLTDPSFVNANADDYSLQPWSAARDAGVTIAGVTYDFVYKARPQDGEYDIGAFEGGAFTLPTAPSNVRWVH